MLTKFGGVVTSAGSTAITIVMHTKKWFGVFHLAAFVKSSLKSGVAAEAEAALAAVCLVSLVTLVSITNILFVQQHKELIS
jgi:hypothetical protein